MYYKYVRNGDVRFMGFWSWLGLPEKSDVMSLQSEINLLRKDNEEFYKHNLEMQKELGETYSQKCDTVINEILLNRKQLDLLFQNTNSCIEHLMTLLTENQKESKIVSGQMNEKIEECIKLLAENKNLISKHDEKALDAFKSESDSLCCEIIELKNNALEKLQENTDVNAKENAIVLNEITRCAGEIELMLAECQKCIEMSQDGILKNSQLLKGNENQMKNVLSIASDIKENTNNMDETQKSLSSLSESVKYLWTIMKTVWVDSMLSDIESVK